MPETQTPGRSPATIRICALLFICGCLLSSVRLIRDAPKPSALKESAPDIANRSDRRFEAVRSMLPERGVVGYTGEPGIPALEDYYLAQYALAPVVVDHSSEHALVVGNFPSAKAFPATDDLQLVRDFGNGVLLFRKKDSK